jgi:hypothetical protein
MGCFTSVPPIFSRKRKHIFRLNFLKNLVKVVYTLLNVGIDLIMSISKNFMDLKYNENIMNLSVKRKQILLLYR